MSKEKDKKELTFHEKMVAIISELKINKSQFNSFGKYSYRSHDDILEAVKPLLHRHGLTLKESDKIILVGERYYVEATAIVKDGYGNSETTTGVAREPLNRKGMDESQITGTASSYAGKRALGGMFCIDDTKDADATNNHQDEITESSDESPGDYVRVAGKLKGQKLDDIDLPVLHSYIEWADKIEGGLKGLALQDLHAIKKYLEVVGE